MLDFTTIATSRLLSTIPICKTRFRDTISQSVSCYVTYSSDCRCFDLTVDLTGGGFPLSGMMCFCLSCSTGSSTAAYSAMSRFSNLQQLAGLATSQRTFVHIAVPGSLSNVDGESRKDQSRIFFLIYSCALLLSFAMYER